MIEAKPLNPKGLGDLPTPDFRVTSRTVDRRDTNVTATVESSHHNSLIIDSSTILKELVVLIVNKEGPLSRNEIEILIKKHCYDKNYLLKIELFNLGNYLKQLFDEGKVARILIDRRYYYMPKGNYK